MTKFIKLIILLSVAPFVFFSSYMYSQNTTDFDSLRRVILAEKSIKNIEKAFAYTDTLDALAKTKRERIKAQMTRAALYNQQGDLLKAIDIAMEAEKAYPRNRRCKGHIETLGFIASNFRELSLNNEALYYLNKAKRLIKCLRDKELKGEYGALLSHEKIALYQEEKKYDEAQQAVEEAYEYIDLIKEEKKKTFLWAKATYLEGITLYHKRDLHTSEKLFYKALASIENKEGLLYGQIQLGLAQIYLDQEEYEKVNAALQEVEDLVKHSNYYQLRIKYYRLYALYYEAIEDIEKYVEYGNLYIETRSAYEKETLKTADQSLLELRNKIAVKQKKIWYLIGGGGLVILLVTIIIYRRYKKNQKINKRFQIVIQKLRAGQQLKQQSAAKSEEEIKTEEESVDFDNGIAEETEQRILKALQKLENTKIYLDPDITLTKIATTLDTNTKYLAFVIKRHHHKNFNTYINDLRVNYILKKLQENPKYLAYKISYLADEAGFSSHSKFSAEFKRVVEISPSVFIKQLQASME